MSRPGGLNLHLCSGPPGRLAPEKPVEHAAVKSFLNDRILSVACSGQSPPQWQQYLLWERPSCFLCSGLLLFFSIQ
jgi:hypothetical protein